MAVTLTAMLFKRFTYREKIMNVTEHIGRKRTYKGYTIYQITYAYGGYSIITPKGTDLWLVPERVAYQTYQAAKRAVDMRIKNGEG